MISGVVCALFSVIMIFIFAAELSMPLQNIFLSILHGSFVASGLILLSIGAKYLPAAEFMLLSLTEVVGGVLWCWIPFFGVNEVPQVYTMVGGLIIIFSIAFHAIGTRQKPIPPTL